jgi:hypothetical protein
MKSMRLSLGALAVAMLVSGCVVRSVAPWLGEGTRINDARLSGMWNDAEAKVGAVFCSRDDGQRYNVVLVGDDGKDSRFVAELHEVDGKLLLLVGPPEVESLSALALVPGHLLFRVEHTPASLKLYPVELDAFPAKAAAAGVQVMPDGDRQKGYTAVSPTTNMEAFVRAELKAPGLFAAKPLYQFVRQVPAPASPQ